MLTPCQWLPGTLGYGSPELSMLFQIPATSPVLQLSLVLSPVYKAVSLLGTHVLPRLLKHCSVTAACLECHWCRGARATPALCGSSLPTGSYTVGEETPLETFHTFSHMPLMWRLHVVKLPHLLRSVYDNRLFHRMLLFFQDKMLSKANHTNPFKTQTPGKVTTQSLGLKIILNHCVGFSP